MYELAKYLARSTLLLVINGTSLQSIHCQDQLLFQMEAWASFAHPDSLGGKGWGGYEE